MEPTNATWPESWTETWPDPWRVNWVAETGSTNTDLVAQGLDGAAHGTVLVTDHQTAGRGRLGRTWSAPPGSNLLVSLLFREGIEVPQALTQRVAVAAARACATVAHVTPTLKWPNDLLLGERKLAGVLAQAGSLEGRVAFVVVGMGLNIGWAPPDAARLPSGTRDEVLRALLEELLRLPVDIAAEYRSRLATLGETVRVELVDGAISGVAVDVDRSGRLVVDTATGRRVIDVGDVVHLRQPT
jgi:BirA family transcriptional regulator, biotin operon repressor / biotin---[acetyl-CoA-carboxylase] ligase